MKKLFVSLLCFGIVVFCACGRQIISTNEMTTIITISEKNARGIGFGEGTEITLSPPETKPPEHNLPQKTTTTVASTSTQIKVPEYKSYPDVLNSILNQINDKNSTGYSLTRYYALYDIDGNGTEELLLGGNDGDGSIVIYCIMAAQNGGVI